MKIGVHPSNLHLRLAQAWPGAFEGLEPAFVPYPEGRDTAKLLAGGAIDFGGTGSTPPIAAEAAGLAVVYLAASVPRPANGGLFVRADSAVRSVGALRGKRITLVDGSFQTFLLARSLEAEGLRLGDVETVELAAASSLPALLDGSADGWIAMAPRLEQALDDPRLRLIARCGATIPNRSLFWTLAGRGMPENAHAAIATELARIGAEVSRDPRRAAELLARAGDADAAAWERVVRSRDFRVVPADDAILREQQDEADTLFRHGYFPRAVRLGAHRQHAA